jgi:hypothetical protein
MIKAVGAVGDDKDALADELAIARRALDRAGTN